MRLCFVLGCALALAACDGGDDGTDSGGSDGGSTDAGAGMPVDVILEVRDSRDDAPIAGATVAWDAPGGARVEEVTDATGHVTLSADWALGTGAVTVDADGHILASVIGMTAENVAEFSLDGVLPIRAGRERAETVTVSGTFLNTMDDTHVFNVVPTVPGATSYNGVGPDFEVEVPVGEAFGLVGIEYTGTRTGPTELMQTIYARTSIEVPAATADVTGLEIDLSAPDTAMSVDGSLSGPGMGTPLADAALYAVVNTLESGFNEFLGGMTAAAPNATTPNDVDYTISWYEHPSDTPFTRFILSDDPNFSVVVLPGYPTAGAQDISFPPPPEVITPAFGVMHPIHDPFVIGRIEPGLAVSLNVYDLNQEDLVLWQITGGASGDTISIPQPPSTVVRSDLFPSTGDFYVRPLVCQFEVADAYCSRFAVGGRAFDIVP